MRMLHQSIEVEAGSALSSTWAFPDDYAPGASPCVVLAPGAGSNMHHPFLRYLQEALAGAGIVTVTFNFLYTEAGRKVPDPPPRLLRTWRAVLQRVRAEAMPPALFAGGRSMGGRIASMVAAEGEALAGLVLLGYPLQPAGRPEVVRSEHFSRIACPMLFVQGTRDSLCDLELLRGELKKATAPVALHVIEEGDHSFKVPRRTGKSERDVWEEIARVVASWVTQAQRGATAP
jgi:hypothetical protein